MRRWAHSITSFAIKSIIMFKAVFVCCMQKKRLLFFIMPICVPLETQSDTGCVF